MVITIDSLGPEGKRRMVVAATVVGLAFSVVTFTLRSWARLSVVGRLYREDWVMALALFLSLGFVICNFYGLSVGLGEHAHTLTKAQIENLNISIWIIQRFQAPSIFCVKTSIILLYVRLFPTPTFRKVAWGAWIYTALWTVGSFLASTLECIPVSYFWNKDQQGHCVKNSLTTIGFSNGFLSFVGDLFILCMPLPMIWHLHLNRKNKLALTAIFLCGIFVVGTSIIRLVALFTINPEDISFTQVQAGIWTYLEVSIGITCGNLPLLRPLFRRFLDATSSGRSTSQQLNSGSKLNSQYRRTSRLIHSQLRSDGFERMGDKKPGGRATDAESNATSGSELELQEHRARNDGITIQTDIEMHIEVSDPTTRLDGAAIGNHGK